MKAVYPGSFDPVTNGHLDIIERASKLYEELTVLVSVSPSKKSFFTPEERVYMLKEATKHLKNVKVDYFDGLTVEYAKNHGAGVLVRGLRAVSDFEYEFSLAAGNNYITDKVEMVFLMSHSTAHFISSSAVKEFFLNNVPVDGLVPPVVVEEFKKKSRK